jgi:hypothetical protein
MGALGFAGWNGREPIGRKRGWEDKLSYFSEWAVTQQLKDELLFLVDEDTAA